MFGVDVVICVHFNPRPRKEGDTANQAYKQAT